MDISELEYRLDEIKRDFGDLEIVGGFLEDTPLKKVRVICEQGLDTELRANAVGVYLE